MGSLMICSKTREKPNPRRKAEGSKKVGLTGRDFPGTPKPKAKEATRLEEKGETEKTKGRP